MTARHRSTPDRRRRGRPVLAGIAALALAFGTFTVAHAGTPTAANPYDQLRADVAVAEQADQAKDAQLAADQKVIADQKAKIAQLEAAVNPPAPVGTVWGINATSTAQHATQTQVWAPSKPWAWRYYLQPGEALHLPTEYQLGPGEQLVLSSKILPQQLTVAQVAAFFRTVPAGVTLYYTNWHEPEDDIARGHFTAAQYRAQFNVIRQAQQQVGNPHIKIAAILMGYTWQKGSGRNPEDYIPAAGQADLLTTDTYFDGSIGGDISTAGAQFAAQIATAKAHGLAWGITETGVGPKLTGQARLAALTAESKLIKADAAALGLYFDQGRTTDEWWLSPAEVAAWKAGQAA